MKRKRMLPLLAGVGLCALPLLPSAAAAAGLESLRGLSSGVTVHVAALDPDAKKARLTEEQVKSEMERQLQNARVPVIDGSNNLLTVRVAIALVRGAGLYAYSARISLDQDVPSLRFATGGRTPAALGTANAVSRRRRFFLVD
jgi:hypothetical protein